MERISFTRPAAARIARAVRVVENARPGGQPLETQRQDTLAKARVFRVCTYTGAWAIGSAKTVTFKNRTSTPNTVSATNLFFPVTSTAAGSRDCAVAKDGTAWYLVDVVQQTTAVIVLTGVSLGTAGLQFTRASITVASTATESVSTITTTACA
jgi:hypothetical protein